VEILEIIFLIPVLGAFIELILGRWWVPVYFQKGIPLFKKSFIYYKDLSISTSNLSDDLSVKFHRIILPAIIFKKISEQEIAFRETFIHYFQFPYIMRGLVKIENNKRKFIIFGYINWYVLCLLFIFVLYILSDPLNFTHLREMIGLFLLILVIIYISVKFKFRLYIKIFKYLENKYSKNINGENNA
jgi:hypothetical protein